MYEAGYAFAMPNSRSTNIRFCRSTPARRGETMPASSAR
jgi:hypothetical protein